MHLLEGFLVLVIPRLDLADPLEHVLLDDLNLEEHVHALLIVVQELVQVDPDHEHRACVGLLAELLDDVFRHFVLDVLDHSQDIFFVFLNQVFIKNLRFVLRLDVLQTFWLGQKLV